MRFICAADGDQRGVKAARSTHHCF